jgi:hypothetical protein
MTACQIRSTEDYLLRRKRERYRASVRRKLAKVHLRHAEQYRDQAKDPYSPAPANVSRSLMRFNARLWRFYTAKRHTVLLVGGAPRAGAAGGGASESENLGSHLYDLPPAGKGEVTRG